MVRQTPEGWYYEQSKRTAFFSIIEVKLPNWREVESMWETNKNFMDYKHKIWNENYICTLNCWMEMKEHKALLVTVLWRSRMVERV